MSYFKQSNIKRKNCVRTTRYKRLLEMFIVQHVEMKSVFTFLPIKRLFSTTVKSAKPAATFWILLFKDQNPTIMFIGGDGTHCFARKTSRDYEKEKPSPFWRNFFADHNQAHPSLNQKMSNRVQIWNKPLRFLLADDFSHIFNIQIILFTFNLQPTSQT